MTYDVLIVGAGAIGLTLAEELASRGRAVAVVDREPIHGLGEHPEAALAIPRRTASWAAAGILPPANLARSTDALDQLRGLSHRRFPELAERLRADTGIDCQLRRCGGWYLADSVGELASMTGMVHYWRDLEIECVATPLEELVRREPALRHWAESTANAKAWWVPDEYQLSPPRFLAALATACRHRGVDLRERRAVTGIERLEDGVAIEATPAGSLRAAGREARGLARLEARQLVLCGGTWTGLIDASLRLTESLVPVRGQMLLLRPAEPLLHSVINLGQRYLVPRLNGDVLVGSCEEEVGFQHGTTPAKLAELRRFVYQICPPLRAAQEVSSWSGLRPLTFDGFPVCGKLPGTDSVFIATGHFRSGIHLSPATALCMADLMTGRIPPIDLDAFRVGKQQTPSPIGNELKHGN
jgi:glycine oxidase